MKATATCRHVATTTEGGAKDSDVATTTEGAATTADVCYRRCLRRRCLGHLAAVRPANEPEPGQLCRAVLPQHPTWPHLPAATQQCMEQRSCGCSQLRHSAPPGMAVGCCELWLSSTPRYRLVCNCFPDPDGGLPVRIWPGTIQVSRSR